MAILSKENPVLRAELKHQQHVMNTSRSGRIWILLAMVMLIPALLTSLVFTLEAFTGLHIWALIMPPEQTNGSLFVTLLIIMNIALYVVVTLITMGLASNSISREQEGRTWESLLLTTLDVRQIVWGKWWATLHALWGDHIMIGILRVGAVSWIALVLTDVVSPDARPDLFALIVALGLTAAYTAVDAALSAALGLITPLGGMGNSLFMVALIGRVMVIVIVIFAVSVIANLLPESTWRITLAALAGLGLLALLTLLTLRLCEVIAVWQQAAPPRKAS